MPKQFDAAGDRSSSLRRNSGTVVLAGPVCVGKSTVLPLVAAKLGRRAIDVDDVAPPYLDEVEKGFEALNAVGDARGFLEAQLWWEPGLVHVVERVLSDYPGSVIAMGAGHTHYLADGLLEVVAEALAGAVVILMLPTPDLAQSLQILRGRALKERDSDWIKGGIDFLERWIKDPDNYRLATATVYTESKTPPMTADDIASIVLAIEAEKDDGSSKSEDRKPQIP